MSKGIKNIVKHLTLAYLACVGGVLIVAFLPIIILAMSLYSLSLDNPLDFWDDLAEGSFFTGGASWMNGIFCGVMITFIWLVILY